MSNINPNQMQSWSQVQCIKNFLLSGRKLTAMDALRKYQVWRLGARIWDLKQHPHLLNIRREMKQLPNGKRVAEYSLIR